MLALTPAREYYGSQIDDGLDPSEQWNRKKQSKEEKRAAKKAKLDPANQKSALDVMKEREKKRKRELGMDDEENDDESHGKPLVSEAAGGNKRQKQEQKQQSEADIEARSKEIREKRKEKRDRKKEKIAAKRAKVEAKKARKQAQSEGKEGNEDGVEEGSDDDEGEAEENDAADLEKVDFSGLADSDDDDQEEHDAADASSAPTSPAVNSPAFDVATNQSEASSSSSISPPSVTDELKPKTQATSSSKPRAPAKVQPPPKQVSLPRFDAASIADTDVPSGTSSPKLQLPNVDQALLQERLRKRIEELRAQRKADGPDGTPAQSRQQLLDQRRRKDEQRKAHKKELRQKAREEEARKRDEELRGTGSPAADIFERRDSPRPHVENNFSFSRLAFDDGTAADASLSTLQDPKKRKGPQDPKTALLAAEKKQSRLSGLDEKKRSDIAEKDMWLNAKKRAHGERIRDDTSLLKKALKRKEKQKGKSEHEWKERKEAIVKGREMKQKKREANLQKRKDEKGQKGKKKGGPSSKGGKKKSRPGFEGSFKA